MELQIFGKHVTIEPDILHATMLGITSTIMIIIGAKVVLRWDHE
jgi:hypothetical protein